MRVLVRVGADARLVVYAEWEDPAYDGRVSRGLTGPAHYGLAMLAQTG